MKMINRIGPPSHFKIIIVVETVIKKCYDIYKSYFLICREKDKVFQLHKGFFVLVCEVKRQCGC